MAVAAYAAVVSLMHVLHQIEEYPPRRLHLDRNQIETLHVKVSFLQDFLEVHSQRFYEDLEGLATKIAEVAGEAEEIIDAHVVDKLISQRSADEVVADEQEDMIIDSHVMDQLHKVSADESDMDLSFYCEGIDNVIEEIDSIKKELIMIKEGTTIQEQGLGVFVPPFSSTPPSGGNNTMVGFDEQFDRIVWELRGGKHDLQVLPIVGMGGIGKTTLARTAFDDWYVAQHFGIRTWVTISQDYSMKKVLLGLLSDEESSGKKYEESDKSLAELGDQFYKKLYDRRYLVAMDDVWSTKIWDDLRSFFPDNGNGSRIMVTTRLSNVAVCFSSRNPYLMDFLDDDKSWDLFRKKAFVKESCPPELEEVGKSIAKSCKGLPLAIIVIGGLLSKSNVTREYWEIVAKDVNSFANSADDGHCLKILSLSYKNLPIQLKPCFLYMRKFPEDHDIKVSELIRLWVAEGFLKPMKDETLEKVAQGYLKDLTERNLILIHEWTRRGRMKSCGIHDLLRDLCIRESRKELFYFVPKVQTIESNLKACFLCACLDALTTIYLLQVVVASQPTSLANRLVCDNCRNMYPQLHKLRLVKVLESNMRSRDEDILHPNKLRYLAIYEKHILVDNLIHLLWNLQTIVIHNDGVILPSEIWELPQLRHLIVYSADLPNPPLITQVDRKDSTIILKNLRTLSGIRNFKWSEDAIERLLNLRTLGINYDPTDSVIEVSYFSLHNLGLLHDLESLSLEAIALHTLKDITFPQSLKKLSLQYCNIPWEEMTIVSLLPNLEVLKLRYDAFEGPEWNPVEGEFLRLKILFISETDLVRWEVEQFHFPNLEHLDLRYMRYLEKIPSGIGEIQTLRSIRLRFCTESVVNSAKDMRKEQHDLGNEDLQLYVNNKLVPPDSD